MESSQQYQIGNSTLSITLGSISEATTEVIATSDDTQLSMGGGSSLAVLKEAGKSVYEESRVHVPLNLGSVIATSSGNLAEKGVKHIYHAASIPSAAQPTVEDESLVISKITLNCLNLLKAMNLSSISMPAFGTGFARFDATTAAIAMAGEIQEFLANNKESYFVEIRLLLGKKSDLASLTFFSKFTERAQLQEFAISKHAVVMVHGIRTQASWREKIRQYLIDSDPTLYPIFIGYGFFDVFRFLIPINKFREDAAAVVFSKMKPLFEDSNLGNVSVIAHSFGTWIIAHLLIKEETVRFHRIIFCGAVVDRNYDWNKVSHKIGPPNYTQEPVRQVINDCGNNDIWPVLAESSTWGFGASGRNGFGHTRVKDRFHDYPHGGFFKEEDFVKDYWGAALANSRIKNGVLDGIGTNWFLSVLTVLKIRFMLPLILLIIAVFYFILL